MVFFMIPLLYESGIIKETIRWDVGSETTCDLLLYFNLPLSRIVLYDILLAGNRIKVDFFTSFFLILPVFRPLTVEWA